jgi:hypothetical protein
MATIWVSHDFLREVSLKLASSVEDYPADKSVIHCKVATEFDHEELDQLIWEHQSRNGKHSSESHIIPKKKEMLVRPKSKFAHLIRK